MTGLNSFFDDFFTKDLFNWNEKKPYRNGIYHAFCKREKETETNYEIEMAVPGLKKKILKLTSIETFLPFLRNLKPKTKKEMRRKLHQKRI